MTQVDLSAHDTNARWRANLRRYYVFSFLSELQLWMPVWVLYLQVERGLSLTQITLLDGPFWLVVMLAEVPTGAVADRWGRKPSLVLGALTFSAAIALFGLASTYPILLLSYLVWGISLTLISGANSAFLFESLAALGRPEQFRKCAGRAQAFAIIAGMIGVLVGAPLAAQTSLATPILVSAVVNLGAVAVALTFSEPPHQQHEVALSYRRVLTDAVRYTLGHAAVRAMIGVRAMLMAAGMVAIIFTQPFLRQAAVPVEDFGWLMTPLRLLSIVGALTAYRFALRFGERRALYVLAAASVGALLALGTTAAVWAVAMFGVLGFVNSNVGLLTTDYLNHRAPNHLRATVLSVAQMAFSVLLVVLEPGLGLLADRTSLQTMFLAYAAVGGTLTVAALVVWSRADQREALPMRERGDLVAAE